MPFPTLAPTSRTFEAGDYPVKRFMSQNGAETRILYGSRRTGQRMSLTYQNIFDHQAEEFIDHYDEVFGTLNPFSIASEGQADAAKSGWNAFDVPDPVTTDYPAGTDSDGNPYVAGKYEIKVTPKSLIEGQSFEIRRMGKPGASVTTKYSAKNNLTLDDFTSGFLGISSLPHSATEEIPKNQNQANDGRGYTYIIGGTTSVKKDAKLENREIFLIEMFSTDSTPQLLASTHVPITDSGFSINNQPLAQAKTIGVGSYSEGWRYEGPPQLTQVRPGVSTVTVNLIGVLGAS